MKSRVLCFILGFVCLWSSMAMAQSGGGEFAGGDGSAEKPFLIENKYQLRNMGHYQGDSRGEKHFKLIKDISFEMADFEWGGDFYNAGKGWTPIGENNKNSFYKSVFDGNGFSIRGLYSSRDTYVGLFGYTYESTIKNLFLLDCRIVLGGHVYRPHAGLLVGHVESGRIEHCYCDGEIKFTGWESSYVGGIAGEVSRGEVLNSYAKVVVRQEAEKQGNGYHLGGIAGVIISGASIRNCYADVDMKADSADMGGIVGLSYKWYNTGGLVENSYVRGYLSTRRALGGICSGCVLSSFRGNCVLLTEMEGKGLKKTPGGGTALERVVAESTEDSSFLDNYVSEKMQIKTDFPFKPVEDANGRSGALCAEKPDIAFWKRLGFSFGETPDAPWVFSSSGFPVIYGFDNLDMIYLRDLPDSVLGKRFKSLYEYFIRNRDNCSKSRAAEMSSGLTRLNESYKKALEEELKNCEEENWALASVVKKELDALNASQVDDRIESSLPETVIKRKKAYLEARAKWGKDSTKWDDTLMLLKERYRDGLVAFQKDCLAAKEMKLAFLAERELKKL